MVTKEQVKAAKEAFINYEPAGDFYQFEERFCAALEAADAAAWRPIEEAPKGTVILVWRKHRSVVTAYWDNILSCWRNPMAVPPALYEPTHFRPLPTPPKEPPE